MTDHIDFSVHGREYKNLSPGSANFQVVDTDLGKSMFVSVRQPGLGVLAVEMKYEDFLNAFAGALNASVENQDIDSLVDAINQEATHG